MPVNETPTAEKFKARLRRCTFVLYGLQSNASLFTDDGFEVCINFSLSRSRSISSGLINHVIKVYNDEGKVVDSWGNDTGMLTWYREFYNTTVSDIDSDKELDKEASRDEWLSK